MKSYVKQALIDFGKSVDRTISDDDVEPDEFILYRSMEMAMNRIATDYSKQLARLEKKKAASGATNTESGKENFNQNQYNISSMEIQVIPWEMLDVSAKATLSDLFRGGDQL